MSMDEKGLEMLGKWKKNYHGTKLRRRRLMFTEGYLMNIKIKGGNK